MAYHDLWTIHEMVGVLVVVHDALEVALVVVHDAWEVALVVCAYHHLKTIRFHHLKATLAVLLFQHHYLALQANFHTNNNEKRS